MSAERDGWKPHKTFSGGYTMQFRFGTTTEWIGHAVPCADGKRFAAIDTFGPRKEYNTYNQPAEYQQLADVMRELARDA